MNDISRLRVKIYWLKKILILPVNSPRCSIADLLTFQDAWSISYFIYFAMKTERLLAFILIDFRRDFLAFNMHIKVVKLSINLTGTLTHENNNLKKTKELNQMKAIWKLLWKWIKISFLFICLNLIFFTFKSFLYPSYGKKIIYHFTSMV